MKTRLVLLVCVSLAAAFGQGERGTLNGTVADSTGAVVAGAIVKAINVETNVETGATTTSAGVFRLPYLPPGNWTRGTPNRGICWRRCTGGSAMRKRRSGGWRSSAS